MTDLDLQKAIVDEVKEMIVSHHLQMCGEYDEIKDFTVYTQEKPYKNDYDIDEEEQENYIIVMLDDEDINENQDYWTVQVHIIISINLYEKQHQGNLIIADIMNNIHMWLTRKKSIGYQNQYKIEHRAHKRFNQECYPEYCEGDLITFWHLPIPEMEGVDNLL